MKKIQVQVGNNVYTYQTEDDVKVGDTVTFPNPFWLQDVKGVFGEGKVKKLGSDYDGECVTASLK